MKLQDFPPQECLGLISSILSRYEAAKERWPIGRSIKTEVHLTINDARLFYAAGQWLKKYSDWNDEARRAGGRIGLYPVDFSLFVCMKRLIELAECMNKEEPIIFLSEKDIKILDSAAYHLDHYELMLMADKGRKRK